MAVCVVLNSKFRYFCKINVIIVRDETTGKHHYGKHI